MGYGQSLAIPRDIKLNKTSDRIDLLFDQVLQQAVTDRHSWLQQHCNDETMLEELLSLLDAHEQAGDFLQQPLEIDVKESIGSDFTGRQLGPYQIDSLLAHGGMGRIYRAHRSDGEYEQQVAIKLIESANINPELLRYERQILADLHHPNIVSLIDGGTLEEGTPYLVMEFIQGRPIDQYVQQEKLTQHQTLRLFCALAKIVSQTHQHGVIHCDLKPDNILVTKEGDLKLLDFGVAHLYSMATAEQAPRSHALTPEYASPQRHKDPLPRVSDDIYSLGVIFGVMLSGEVPNRPSTGNGGCAQMNHIEAHLGQERRAIFCKATNPDPELRYQTADEISADIFRWFDQKPLLAMGNGHGYRARKFLRRNWQKIIAASILSFVIITLLFAWQAQKETTNQIEDLAVMQVRSMLRDLDRQMEELSGSTPARVAAAEQTLEQLQSVSLQQPNDLKIKSVIAEANRKLGMLLGHPFQLHMNQFERGRQHLKRALTLYQELLTKQPNNIENTLRVVRTKRMLAAIIVFVDGETEKGLKIAKEGLATLNKLRPDPFVKNITAVQHVVISHLLTKLGRFKEAAEGHRKAELLLIPPDKMPKGYQRRAALSAIGFFLDEKASFALARKDYIQATHYLEKTITEYQGRRFWRDRRRISRVNYALACIGLINKGSIITAKEQLQKAKEGIEQLSLEYPSAFPLHWELNRYAPLGNLKLESHNEWITAFDCHNAHLIMEPPIPPAA